MRREQFLRAFLGALAAPLAGCYEATGPETDWREGLPGYKPKSEWEKLLSGPAFYILFEEGTEQPGTSQLNQESRQGTFICAACFNPLFSSETKYDSGTGWPSFWQPLQGSLGFRADYGLAEPRTEYHCAHCGGHQGHVFDDGPPPTFKRYCNNGLALQFVPTGGSLPPLRS